MDDRFEQARLYALGRLERELSPKLLYHGLAHTRDDVVPAVETLSEMEGVEGEPLTLLRVAAWFHDLGFVEQSVQHELIGIRIAAAVLPGFGYSEAEIDVIRTAISATIIPQSPTTELGRILADADLNVLGRADFLSRNQALRDELALTNRVFSDAEWYTGQVGFLEKHSFFTRSAESLWGEQKQLNIRDLRGRWAASINP
jgi:uncharacterized protein